jgi:hypothetical protein
MWNTNCISSTCLTICATLSSKNEAERILRELHGRRTFDAITALFEAPSLEEGFNVIRQERD